jgi:protein-S-isoprenylcysteine O-methyltransferase Ste14
MNLEHRVPPPLVMLLTGLAMWFAAGVLPRVAVEDTLRIALAVALLAAGLAVCLAGVFAFRRAKTTVNPLKPETASTLVIVGIYKYTRNPMYLGFALLLLALAVYLASPLTLAGVAAFVLYINRFQIAPEERALTALFGEDFRRYITQVRRWL